MQYTYSFLGSPLHLVLKDEIAEGYNRFVDSFLAAQELFAEEYGVKWTPELPIEPKIRRGDVDAYNNVGRVINLLVEINGGALDISEEQCTSPYLIRI